MLREHDPYGKSIKDTVLCFPHGHSSTIGSFVLYTLAKNGTAPKAIVNFMADSVVVVGAVIAKIPMVDGRDISEIKTSDIVEVDRCNEVVRVYRRG